MTEAKSIFTSRIKIARTFFIISALYGLTLRLYHIVDFIPIAYKNILQAHSHVTFLGWGFLAVITIIEFVYYPKKQSKSPYTKWLFRVMTYMLFGMLISFPLQGYKLFSILFLSIFLITSYLYLFQLLKNLKEIKTLSTKFIKTGVYYYFLSSLAIWAVAIITTKFGKIDLYFNSVYFYLHFLYNGFFVFVLFGLLIRYFEVQNIYISNDRVLKFYWFTNIALIPAYVLSLLWNQMPNYIYIIGFIAVFLQLISLLYLFTILRVLLQHIKSKHLKNIAYFVFIAYFLKIILQFFSAFPSLIKIALQLKSYFIVGYLHLYTLGFMSLFIILLLKLLTNKALSKTGIQFLMLGIFLSEILLYLQGILQYFFKFGIPKIQLLLFLVSVFMPLGLIMIHFKIKFTKKDAFS